MKLTWCIFYSQYISSILFITSTCFGPFQVHHQEEQLYLCDTWYLLFCTADSLVCRSTPESVLLHTRQSVVQNNKTKCRINTVFPPDDGIGEVRNM